MLTLQGRFGIRLIPFQQIHAGSLYRLIAYNRPHLEPWLPWIRGVRSVQDAKAYITRSQMAYAGGQQIHFGIWYGNLLAGSVTVERIDPTNRLAELGYWLGSPYTGRGWMIASTSRVIHYLFDDRDLNRVEIRCEIENTASAQVARHLGFQLEGTLRQALWKDGKYADLYVFGLLRSQWRSEAVHPSS
jgi:ribosomal-protein-serine acetyltransferase